MKVVVGSNTIVKKVTVGTPLRVGSAANGTLTGLDDVNGSINLVDGSILQYDSASGLFKHVSPATITGSGLNIADSGGLGSISYDSQNAILTYTGPSSDSIHSLFNATYDSNSLGTLSYTDGEVRLVGPTAAQIRALFSAGNDLQYNETTGEFSVTIPGGGGGGGANFDSAFGEKTTDDLQEGVTNLYYSDSLSRNAISIANTGGGFGFITYNPLTGVIDHTAISTQQIRNQFSASGDLQYDSNTGQFSITTGAHYTDSDARNAFSVNFIGDTAFDSSPYGGASYNSSTGVLTINGTTDSNIRNSLTVEDSGGLGSLNYFVKQGRIVYKGPETADIAGTLSANLDSLSMGQFTLDSNTGQFTFKLEDDSVRSLFSVVSDDAGGTSLSYDSATGQFTYSGPSDLDLRGKVSAVDAGGDGSFSYHESSGVFTYTGPSPAEVRAHFEGGLGIDYNESTGTFRLDSSANIVTGSIVTSNLRVTDSATIEDASINQTLNVQNINSLDPNGDVTITAGDDVNLISNDKIRLNAPALETTSKQIFFREFDSDLNNLSTSGIYIGGGTAAQSFTYSNDSARNQWLIGGTTGLNVPGSLTGSTIDSLNKRIDELPDSAQMKAILSAGPGLSYDNINGIFRIPSSGVTSGIYGSNAVLVPQISVDSLGIIDSIKNIAITTTDLDEGNNLYYTTTRFDSDLRSNTSRTQVRTYIDSAAGTEPFKDTVRGYFSVNDLGGQGALTYDSDTGQITYTGAVIRKAGNGLDLDSDTGTFRTDSTADVTFNSVQATASVTTNNLSTDSASTKIVHFDNTQYTDVNVPDNLPPFQEGNLFYFQGPDALTYSNASMNVKIGQDEIVRVYNNTGSTITKGKVVYVTGATNDFPTIALAKSDTLETVYETQGLTSHEIPDATYGFVTVRGLYGGLNTSNFNVGDIVHVSPDSAGELVNYSPQFPNYPFEVGVVLVADSASGGNVGGCIQVGLRTEVFENIRVAGNSRFDADVTIAGNLNLLGSETQTKVANLAVSDNFVFLAAGDTVTAQALDSGLNDLSFVGTYTGDSDLAYYVKIQDADSLGDVLVWSFDSNFASLEPFESAGGPTLWNLTTNGLTGDLRYGISFEFLAATGHDSGERWQGDAAPSNLDLGLIGNYNPPDGPFARTGAFRDNADGRFKFFEGYTSEITSSVNTSDSSYQDADIQFGTGYGNIIGNVTGNVTGQVSDLSNHNTTHLAEDPAATDSSGTQYFTSARARSAITVTDAGGDGSLVYDSISGEMIYTGPSEAEFFQHFKDNADSLGDLTFDSEYGSVGGFKLHERHITRHEEVFADSFVSTQEYFLIYSGTTGGVLKKVRADTLASTIGGGGGGAGGGLFGYINM